MRVREALTSLLLPLMEACNPGPGVTVDERAVYSKLERQRDCAPMVTELVRMCGKGKLREPAPLRCNEHAQSTGRDGVELAVRRQGGGAAAGGRSRDSASRRAAW